MNGTVFYKDIIIIINVVAILFPWLTAFFGASLASIGGSIAVILPIANILARIFLVKGPVSLS